MDRGAAFNNLIARRYARSPVADPAAYEEKLARMQRYLSPHARVLEIGCGTGTTALRLAPHAGHILAVDYSKNMIEIAREKQASEGIENVEFRVADIQPMELDGEQFDAVVAMNILHLLPDLTGTLGKLFRALKPGGYFVSSTSCLGETDRMLFKFFLLLGRLLVPYVGAPTKAELTDSISNAGFLVEDVWSPETQPIVAFVIARVDPPG